ncbi:TPA: Gfo/Idh/MocA family oxidoreductase [Candidatus Poribacteria bacterium]|nr:Gfo/Idh/MocA family oxidoreductase [Candidatus Poribacteria bacterium]HEX30998.1 Gfo/Idh/MocA family oxidoreductase [Candidatus Poribacteria bacterium]
MDKLKLALIGAGRRGAGAYLPVIPKMDDVFDFVAICDINPQTAQSFAERHGVNAYTSVRDLVAREKVDVAVLTVPGDAHHPISCFLSEHGVHQLVETPIAITLPLADLMMETARRNGVKIEVAVNYSRAPARRFTLKVIEDGVIGKVSRIYRIFQEGGYHGMSLLRKLAGADPVSILGISHTTPILPITDRMKRYHTEERWTLGYIDFANGVAALMCYSNVIHARSLGRGQVSITQIDGSAGTIVGEDVYVVPEERLQSGAVAEKHSPRRITKEIDGVKVLQSIEMELPDRTIRWENPFSRYPITEGQVAVADELMSIARAVLNDTEPEYGAAAGRLDQEMNIAMIESGRGGRRSVSFPLREMTEYERQVHRRYQDKYGHPPEEWEALVDVMFPRV